MRDAQVLRAAGAMGAATFISRILGLVREQVFAFLFGAGNATDAFNIAFRIPNLLRDLLAEGAMSAALVPTFIEAREKQGERRAWRIAGLVFRILFAFVTALTLLGIFYADELVTLYASAYREIPGKFELTVSMTRVIFPYFPLVVLAAAFMGILNASGLYFLPALASALFNAASIIVGVICSFLMPLLGREPIEGMAIGVVAGGLAQAFCQLPSLYRRGYRFQRRQAGEPPWHRDPSLRKMLWLMIPGTVGMGATQINILVNSILATGEGAGAVSWLNYAFRLMQFPIGVFGVSLAAATLPQVSTLWVRREFDSAGETVSRTLRQVFAINLPASAGLAFLGLPILRLIFEYGQFTANDTQATAIALAMYSVGLVAYSSVKVLVPAFYGVGNTRIPVLSSVISVLVNIALNLLFVGPFGYWGLALGTSVTAFLNGFFLLFAFQRILLRNGASFHLGPLLGAFLRHLSIALLMGAACYGTDILWSRLVGEALHYGPWAIPLRLLGVGGLVVEGVFCVVVLARLMGAEETLEAVQLVQNKLRLRLSRRRAD